jgi:hypothetical protein
MGSGYRTFTAGEVLTASNVQNYLMDQSVLSFADSTARATGIGTANFEEGMLTYLTDVDKLQVYTGAAFDDVYPPAASAQGLTLINTTSFSAVSSVSLPAATFSATYDNYRILLVPESPSDQDAKFRMRTGGADNSTSNYDRITLEVQAAVTGTRSTGQTSGTFASIGAQSPSPIIFDICNPFLAKHTTVLANSLYGRALLSIYQTMNIHKVASSFDAMTIIFDVNTTGNVSVYGYSK